MQLPDWDPIRVLVLADLDLGIRTRQRLTEAQSEGLCWWGLRPLARLQST